MSKKILVILINLMVIVFLVSCNKSIAENSTAVTTNADEYDNFDLWLTEDLEIKAIPTHIFIENGKIHNITDTTINVKEFKDALKTDSIDKELYDEPLYDINGEKIYIKDYDVIYIQKYNCPACEEQNNIEPSIKKKYKNLRFLTYYIKTNKADIDCSSGCN